MCILLSCFKCKNIDDFDEIVRTFALSVFGGAKTPSSPNVHNKTNQGFNLVSKGLNNGGLGCLMYWSFISIYSGNKFRGGVAYRIHVFLSRDKRLHPPLWKLKTLSKIWGSTSWVAWKHWTNFPLRLLGWELGKCTVKERAFFLPGQSQKYSSPWVPKEKICNYWLSGRAGRKYFPGQEISNIFLSSSYTLGQ